MRTTMQTTMKSVIVFAAALTLGCGPDSSATGVTGAANGEIAASRLAAPGLGRFPLLTSGKPKVYRLKGTADMMVQPDGALCYTVPMWDVEQDRVVGQATDCLSEIDASDPTGVVLTGTTTFDFGQGHSFTSQGRTTVRPTMPGSSLDFTHITGAIPAPGSNGVIAGAGHFDGFEATVRLSGAVNLASFPGTTTFDCLFVVMPL